MKTFPKVATLAIATTLLCATAAKAQLLFTVDINTAAIAGNLNGPYYLDFQLNLGSTSNAATNTATISNFNFTGGSFTGGASIYGGTVGFTQSTGELTLTDSPDSAGVLRKITSGTTNIMFTVDLTQNTQLVPDDFVIDILDGNENSIATTAPDEIGLVEADVTSGTTLSDVSAYQSVNATPADNAADGGSGGVIATVLVPEPSTWAMLLGGSGLLAFWRLRTCRAPSSIPARGTDPC